jgi:hypothetical protein
MIPITAVYVLQAGERGEGSVIVGVFATHAPAYDRAKEYMREHRHGGVGWKKTKNRPHLEEWTCSGVDEVYIERWEVK